MTHLLDKNRTELLEFEIEKFKDLVNGLTPTEFELVKKLVADRCLNEQIKCSYKPKW